MKIAVIKGVDIPVDMFASQGWKGYLFDSFDNLLRDCSKLQPHMVFMPVIGSCEESAKVVNHIKSVLPDVYIIALSKKASVNDAVLMIRNGADDFWVLPVVKDKVVKTVEWVKAKFFSPEDALKGDEERTIISVSLKMVELKKLAKQVAISDATVFIQGESGTGKELFARYIHKHSRRGSGPFVAVNCAAIPESLMESELFGYERGAFTGATRQKLGKFELAKGGTILLDEVTEIPVHLQAKLLRVLQEREVERLGGTRPLPIDVRVLATTNINVEEKVKEGSFRKDLFYRLNVIPFKIPPLRKRPEDIIPLAQFFLGKTAERSNVSQKYLAEKAKKKLQEHDWPGNVRELENVIQRSFFLSSGKEILEDHIIFDSIEDNQHTGEEGLQLMPIREMERKLIFKALEMYDGNRTKAAEILGITVRTLRNKLKEYSV